MIKQKTVFTGGSGLLGCTAALTSPSWDLILWLRNHTVTFPGVVSRYVKLENYDSVLGALKEDRPDLVVHAAGMTSIEECEQSDYRTHLSNVICTKILARATRELGIKFVFISTDQVLQDAPFSREEEIGFPKNIYAKSKLDAEYQVQKLNPSAMIVRTNFYSWGHTYRKSFLDFIVDNLRAGKEITLFDDVFFNPASAEDLVKNIASLSAKHFQGTVNVGGEDGLSKYQFGLLAAELFKLDRNLIHKGYFAEAKGMAKRPFNLTMATQKLKSELKIEKLSTQREYLQRLLTQEVDFKERLFSSIKKTQSFSPINYGKQTIDDLDFEAVIAGLDSPWLTQGPQVEAFEKKVAEFTGSSYAVAMANWTCGLHMAVLAAGVKPGDYVVTSPLSFVASSNCAAYVGAKPIFIDIDPKTLNMDPVKLEAALKQYQGKVKAIIPVHFAGAPCDMEKISVLAKTYGAKIIEDAAHAIGGRYLTGEKIGNNRYSDMVGFSFHPVKNLTTGEGGLITTNNKDIYLELLRLRSHGIAKGDDAFRNENEAFTNGKKNQWYYEMHELGFNFRITDLQCALGVSQLRKLDSFLSRKVAIAKSYDQAFSQLKNVKTVQHELRDFSGNHLYVIKVDFKALKKSRYEVFEAFRNLGINLHVHYIPIYKQPYYREFFPVNEKDFIAMENYYEQAVTLPIYPEMTSSQTDLIISTVRELLG